VPGLDSGADVQQEELASMAEGSAQTSDVLAPWMGAKANPAQNVTLVHELVALAEPIFQRMDAEATQMRARSARN